MKNALKIVLLITTISCTAFQLKAQNVEVTDTDVYIRSAGTLSTLRLTQTGSMIFSLSRNSPSYNAFRIDVPRSNSKALIVSKQWNDEYTEGFIVFGDGTAKTRGIVVESDSTLKEDIEEIDSQVEKVKKLKSVNYKWKTNNGNDKSAKGNNKTYGLLAQDLEKIYPDMVMTNDSGVKAIYYMELIPVLIQVTQEQQAIIEQQAERLNDFEKRLSKLENRNNKF
ncbi:MAG: tail fiber domain-containing protein [Prolixibacteraceae bacterium]|jgi:hypothetical protein|nr:tail fiber domain-containing protein [Prolixibacteraceae bacterium]